MSVNKLTPDDSAIITWSAWAVTASASLVALIAWSQTLHWQFDIVSSYLLFPVLGLVAFSIMWSHYIVAEIRRVFGVRSELTRYFKWSGYVVLLLILLHPGLLIYQRFHDGYGLPPGSYTSYVAPGLAWVAFLGTMSLLVFLAYESKRWFERKQWWPYFLVVNDLAMLAVFYHGLKLGSQTQMAWFKYVWYFMGITLVGCFIHKYTLLIQQHSVAQR